MFKPGDLVTGSVHSDWCGWVYKCNPLYVVWLDQNWNEHYDSMTPEAANTLNLTLMTSILRLDTNEE